jgi:hypothetical protein
MGTYVNVPEAWKYSDTPTKTRERDQASAAVRGNNGSIEATAEASGTPDKDSKAVADWSATLEGKYEWRGADSADQPLENTTKITVTGGAEYRLSVTAVEGASASANTSANASISVGGKELDTATIYDRTKNAPTSSNASSKKNPDELLATIVKHTGTLHYAVGITVNAKASRSGEATSATAHAVLSAVQVTVANA